jgi:hypothetical protein
MTQIAPGLHSLGQRMRGRVHAFLIEEQDCPTLIDKLFDTDGYRILEAISVSSVSARRCTRSLADALS